MAEDFERRKKIIEGVHANDKAASEQMELIKKENKRIRDEVHREMAEARKKKADEEAIELANDTDYGLSANVFAGDEAEGVAIAQCLDAGVVSVNEASLSTMVHEFEQEPFKHSGMGPSRMGASSITRYCRKKLIITNRSEQVRGVESLWDGAR